MILNLSEVSDEPLHAQVSRQIRAKILSEDLASGESLPSIRVLAREQRISVITVQRAYDDLEREGLLQARRGKGFWVAPIAGDKKQAIAEGRFEQALDDLVSQGAAESLSRTDMRRILEKILKNGARK